MKAEHVEKLRRRISSRNYAQSRIFKLTVRMQKNARNYYKRCDFSEVNNWLYDKGQQRLARKREWYQRKLESV